MASISLPQFKQTVGGVADNAQLRLGTGGQPKTAERSFLGRAVRWMFGATRQDRTDNRKMMGDLLGGLKQKYGAEVGVRAFFDARPDSRFKDGHVLGTVSRPITAREVKTAIASAKASPLRYAPGGDKFGQVLARAGMRADQLSPDQEKYVRSRLHEQVSLSAHQGIPLSTNEVEKYAAKLVKHAVNHVGDKAAERQQAYTDARNSAGKAVAALAGGRAAGGLPALLLDLSRRTDDLVSDTMLGEGDIGGQDVASAKLRVVKGAVDRMTPDQARKLYEQAMAPDGAGRQLLLAARLAEDHISMVDGGQVGGLGDLTSTLTTLVQTLGARGGIPKDQIDQAMQSIENVRESGPKQHGIPQDALRDAGVKDARAVRSLLDDFVGAIDERAKDVRRREQEELAEVRGFHQGDDLHGT